MSDEIITAHTTTYYRLNPQLSYLSTKTRVEFKRSYLKQDKIMYLHVEELNIYVVYETNKNFNISSYSTLENCLFGAVSLTTNDDIDKYKYSGYIIGFDRNKFFSHSSGGTSRNCIIFGVVMGSSTKIDNRKKIFQFLGKALHKG